MDQEKKMRAIAKTILTPDQISEEKESKESASLKMVPSLPIGENKAVNQKPIVKPNNKMNKPAWSMTEEQAIVI